jgi:hypothetical protein
MLSNLSHFVVIPYTYGMDETLIDMQAAADRLSVTRRMFASNWRSWGIPVVRLGHRTLRWRPEDIEAWAKKRAKRAPL